MQTKSALNAAVDERMASVDAFYVESPTIMKVKAIPVLTISKRLVADVTGNHDVTGHTNAVLSRST